ncbi:hypothetical protein ACFWVM_33800 [Nocardia fluminea]|uniref:hypothetical protein n=1 Tax=Nocardia fluminea TaxID=134984 RepID=UPI00364A387F
MSIIKEALLRGCGIVVFVFALAVFSLLALGPWFRQACRLFAHTFDILANMVVGDLVRIGAGGTSQFRVVEVDDTHARILPTLDAGGAYEFPMRLIYLTPWTE